MPKKVVRSKSGVRPPASNAPSTNLILASLPPADYARLTQEFTTIPLTHRLFLLNRDRPIEHVFFPESGCCSLTTSMENGDSVEVATVGFEGVVGLDLLLGSRVSTVDAFVQVAPGTAQRISAAAFGREMRKGGALFEVVSRYAAALMAQIVQTAACNRLHMVQERCARWLLLTHERMQGDQFPLSHEFLAIMLGVERTTVTTVAGKLQKAGLIRYVHGQVTIVNRAGLERAACECYGMVADRFERAGLAPGQPSRAATV